MDSLSRQFDATRSEIVTSFRERIHQGKRSKLTKQELEELIDIFVNRLQTLNLKQEIQQHCAAEMALLEEGYPTASVAKNYLPLYRKAISLAIKEQRIPLNDKNSHQYTYIKDGNEHLATEHWALTYLKYDQATYSEFARSSIRNNNLKQDSLQPINLQLYLEAVNSLLYSSESMELACAIAAVTGRRYSEVMARGDFAATNHLYQIRFDGQLKKRGKVDSYTIYTLVKAELVLNALARFRVHPSIAALSTASISEINQLNTPVNRLVKHYFQDSALVPVLQGEAAVTIQNLRAIYGEIAIHLFCPPNMGSHRFIQQKLGHLISDSELDHRKNSGSTEHYFHYYLCDHDGKLLADKGVLLEQSSSLMKQRPNSFGRPSSFFTSKQQSSRRLQSSVEQGTLNLEAQKTIKSYSATTHPRPKKTPMNQLNNSNSLEIHAIPPYLHSRLEDISHILELSPTEAIEKSFQWAEMGIALAQELEIESVNPHTVFEQVKALSTEVKTRQQSSSASVGSNGNDSAELAAAKQQIVFLTRSLDRITELFYRSNNQPFQQQAMTNASTTPSISSANTRATPNSSKSFVTEDKISSTKNRTQNSGYTQERKPSDDQKSQKISPPTATISSNNTKRKRDSPGTVAEDINHAIDVIMEFNDTPGRVQEQKFYIGVGSVRDLCSRGDKAIRRVLEERKDEIAKHLAQHQLDQNHNLSRRDSQGHDYPNIDQESELNYHKITQVA